MLNSNKRLMAQAVRKHCSSGPTSAGMIVFGRFVMVANVLVIIESSCVCDTWQNVRVKCTLLQDVITVIWKGGF